jgi:phosphonate transport system substrate-binding protein
MRLRSFFLLILVALALAGVGVRAEPPFRLAVAPHSSARVIFEQYQPLAVYLEKSLGIPVEVQTAPDFTEFARRGLAQNYDLAITTAHQARLLQTDAAYQPLLTYRADFRSVVIVADAGAIRTPRDLHGKPVLGLSPSSLVTLWGLHWLKEQGIADAPVRYVSAADSVAQLILTGEAAAGFVSLANFQKLAPAVQAKLRLLTESPPMAGRVYLLNGHRAALRDRIETAIWRFAETEDGQRYFEANKLDGYRKLRPRELDEMDPYASEVRQLLKQGSR